MEFALGMFAGLILWPWWGLGIFILLCIVDSVLVENENASFGTGMMVVGTAMLVWLAGDMNPFVLAWDNFGNILKFFVVYFAVGGLWSIAKWYLYLIGVRDDMRQRGEKKRPCRTYARNNQARIYAWIGHWPFSMIGSLFGDFLGRIVKMIYRSLTNLYDRMANNIFKDFESE